ncbi:iron ABC transporter permease [Paenibacillus sp. N1-5-1-14]|uniref:FecCD family ABC transporter permease n=1 Tax=Paenibacillus radicibacter TaxID=2972488 RepID=UPI002158E309|nr:iron ABC transporter permease [Paenibacillus radicibacter]MCR8644898.1 iron ABC transporter permease [Paenibacillus radicibacter]
MKRKLWLWGGAGGLLLLLSILVSVMIGTTYVSPIEIIRIFVSKLPYIGDGMVVDWDVSSEQIMMNVRLPRVILGIFVGAALSVAGAAFQGVLRNPLADPYTLGVSSGASVGAAVLIYFGLQFAFLGQWTIPVVAFITGLLSLLLVLQLAQVDGKLKKETLILSGVVMQAFLGAFVSFLVAMSKQVVNEILFWLMGSLAMRGWIYTFVIAPYFLIGFLILMGYARSLNLFALGERQAAYLGVRVERTKFIVLAVGTLLTAAAVSVAGVIGFVGLIVPHLVRLIVGPDYRLIIPLSALGGGIYVLLADTLARTVLSPTEIPLGVVTAFLGAPFFAYLLKKRKRAL